MTAFNQEAFEADGGTWFRNHYWCDCGCTWPDEWSCTCDDDCPDCGATCSPVNSDDLTEETRAEQGWTSAGLSPSQLATVLAALRYWQAELQESDFEPNGPHFQDQDPLGVEEIDALCERLNG